MQEIIFVTSNKAKLAEVQALLNSESMRFTISNEPLDLLEIQGSDLEVIALEKCKEAVKNLGPDKKVFIEDTALSFDEFDGLPGAYIKWFLNMGLPKIVSMLAGTDNKAATGITTVVFYDGEGMYHTFQGRCDGRIVDARGSTKFGWDPIFEPNNGNNLTYAEMDSKTKNAISHRSKAFKAFKEFLRLQL
ncbi:nucleoside triphosphate pyrophosphohydrolase HAM1 Ecym_3147 [Eremothecium cymbalariae DBVPG|uniref:Inosine triphosphate pyrophosphatase n=1 Tax=Eremothecium cymbalariae (strain CBS 270.75 / DBVPG 7215 / KCTC 17166 / NRRL Y-17582) TaxID=931890 RepID=G8JR81_ERECY|nr:Hypothetical protein Ecym_3147 [Eremothecium cymbalariae DBVPG\